MSTVKRKRSESTEPRSESTETRSIKHRGNGNNDFGPEFSEDLKGMVKTQLQKIKEQVEKELGQKKKNEEAISRVSLVIKAKIDELKSRIEKKRQSFDKALSMSKKECEDSLNREAADFHALLEAHVKAQEATISKYEKEKENLSSQHEQQRENEMNEINQELMVCDNEIAELEKLLKKQDGKLFCLFREALELVLKPESVDDFQDD